MNPLYNQLNQSQGNDFLQRFQQFKNSFRGNPQEQVQQLLNSGKVTQQQYDNAVRLAQQMQNFMSK